MERTERRYLNAESEDEMVVWGYRPCWWRMGLVGLGTLCSGGLLLLFLYWVPRWSIKCTCRLVSLREASVLLLQTTDEFRTCYRVRVRSMAAPGHDPLAAPHPGDWKEPACSPPTPVIQRAEYEKDLLTKAPDPGEVQIRYVDHQEVRYVWSPQRQEFRRLTALDQGVPCSDIHGRHAAGLPARHQEQRKLFYGENQIDVKVPSIPHLLVKEVLNPFHVFQTFSVILWSCNEYYQYATAIVIMSLLSICISLYFIRKQYTLLHDMVAAHNVVRVKVYRGNGVSEEMFSTDLVPGDVVLIPIGGMLMPCDAVLVTGTCVVNESLLTGESVPVMKTSLPEPGRGVGAAPEEVYSVEAHKRHTLFCGTAVVQTRFYSSEPVKAVVVRTGFYTSKGQLVCSILFPKAADFKLYRDAYRFLLGLVAVAAVGMVYSIVHSCQMGEDVGTIIVKTLDIITITVPPALPAAMTAGIIYAQQRLRKQRIYSINPQRINMCGQLNLVCFDKTGTLTEDGLDVSGFLRVHEGRFLSLERDVSTPSLVRSSFIAAMATCHSLTNIDGKLSGDPLDCKMFEATGWVLEEPTAEETALHDQIMPTVVRPAASAASATPSCGDADMELQELMNSYEIGIVSQFPFSSALQRMSVVTSNLGQRRLVAFMKGAPETVAGLCKKETVPDDFSPVLEKFTRQGLRVIALARRKLEAKITWHKVQTINRSVIEANMEFLGLIMMQNKLKPRSIPVIRELQSAHIARLNGGASWKGRMAFSCTSFSMLPSLVNLCLPGDNMLTALSVARECGMIPPHGKVVITEAVPPRDGQVATISWQYADDTAGWVATHDTKDIQIKVEDDTSKDGLLDTCYHFAMSGKTFHVITEHFPDLLPKLLLCGTVYARMAPDQKTQLVEEFQKVEQYQSFTLTRGFSPAVCGYFSVQRNPKPLVNTPPDCNGPAASSCRHLPVGAGGLCGVALHIEDAGHLVRARPHQPRATDLRRSLSSPFVFQIEGNLGDSQFLFIDLAIIMSVMFTMSLNPSWKELVPRRPLTSLISVPVLLSMILQTLLTLAFQLTAFLLVKEQPWYESGTPTANVCRVNWTGELPDAGFATHNVTGEDEEEDYITNYENTTIFFVSCCQYLAVAFAFSKGKPFRQPVYRNYFFMSCILFFYGFFGLIMMYPTDVVDDFFELVCVPFDWRMKMLLLIVANLILSILVENFICDYDGWWLRFPCTPSPREGPVSDMATQVDVDSAGRPGAGGEWGGPAKPPKDQYKLLARELPLDPDWPLPPWTGRRS
ncbi:polyamine-transporting ATPase 13A3-like [Leucoraja erinacea]|uniref:polyamine-transporting ATPase 13A3-like n=1 Tax=Leucoraja erinaceus TaxID=7782 RepID=UPI00245727C0|nr:polyamine-transporting ATPase 13A3-like [Leucoraja erinacea]